MAEKPYPVFQEAGLKVIFFCYRILLMLISLTGKYKARPGFLWEPLRMYSMS